MEYQSYNPNNLNSNYQKFPHNLFVPNLVKVLGDNYWEFAATFDTLQDVYDYIKANPEINTDTFKKLMSVQAPFQDAGLPFDQALEDLVNDEEKEFVNFLNLVQEISNVKQGYSPEYQTIKSVSGGHLNIPDYIRGIPECYESTEKVNNPKFINIYSTLSYQWTTNKQQVINRAIILISIINALEKNGYKVNLNTFVVIQKNNELINILVGAKKVNETTDLQAVYKTSCKIEFLRRILFRVLETLPVDKAWYFGYGLTSDEEFVRELYNIGDDDLYFGTPQELGIRGNLENDFIRALTKLKLADKFDVQEITSEIQENLKRLVK